MRNKIITAIAVIACTMAMNAQETCVINGHIDNCKLADGKKIKEVYLTYTNEFGHVATVAKAKVKKGNYTLKCELASDAPVERYTISGFGEGQGISLFVEPGEVIVSTETATQPEQSTIAGTPTNDTYAAYESIAVDAQKEVERQLAELVALHGEAWLESPEGKQEAKRIKAKESIKSEAEALRFLIDHNASPMTPWVVEHSLFPKLSAAYAEQMTTAMATSLHNHPYYHSLRNAMLASTLKVGSEAPDATLMLHDGESRHLSDYRGKHVILNFWSDEEQAAAMMAELKNVYEITREKGDEFVIISVSLENDKNVVAAAVNHLGVDLEGWIHSCDGAGVSSPTAKRYNVDKTPRIILIEPEGHAVSLDMEIDELGMRVEQILSGDLYYLDMEK